MTTVLNELGLIIFISVIRKIQLERQSLNFLYCKAITCVEI